MWNYVINYLNKFKLGRYYHGFQGTIAMLSSFLISLSFTNQNEAVISALTALFFFLEHRQFGFRRRIAQSLLIVGLQVLILVAVSVFIREHYYIAIPINFAIFFILNFYSYFESPNSLVFVPIQYLYLISITTVVEDSLEHRIFAIIIGIVITAIVLLLIWPSKIHKQVEILISEYMFNTRQILEKDIESYVSESDKFKEEQNTRATAIMNILYSLQYGNVFSSTKGKFLFKLAINTQILNEALHRLKKSTELKYYKMFNLQFYKLTEQWKIKFSIVIDVLARVVTEDKHALLELEKEYGEFEKLTRELLEVIDRNKSEGLRLKYREIFYIIGTLSDFAKRLLLYRHERESVSSGQFNLLFGFDNLRNNVLKSLSLKQSPVRFALHISVLLSSSLFLVEYFDIKEGFWIPMTVLLIMKPNHGGTKQKTLNRIGGTIIGLIFSFFVIQFFPKEVIIPLIIFGVFMLVSLIKSAYGHAVVFITVVVVLLMASDYNINELFITRLGLTTITAVFVLISNNVFLPNWSKIEIRNKLIEALNNDLKALRLIIDKADGLSIAKDEIRISMLNSYQSRRQINELYIVMEVEPKDKQINTTLGKQFVIAHERLGQNYSRFIYTILNKKANADLPYKLMKSVFSQSIKNIISNLKSNNKPKELNDLNLRKLYAKISDFENKEDLSDEQKLLVLDVRKTIKRLMELNELSENNELLF